MIDILKSRTMLTSKMILFAVCISVAVVMNGCSETASGAFVQRKDLALTSLEKARTDMTRGFEKCNLYPAEKRVDCSNRDLTFVPSDLPPDTESLGLSENRIQNLWNDSFTRYKHLITLNLGHNDIRMIEHAAFKPLSSLGRLILWSNQNLHLSNGIFKWCPQLLILAISSCGLTSLPSDIRESSSLFIIDLHDNFLTSVNFTDCKIRGCGSIDLSLNSITFITHVNFAFDCQCVSLDLSFNRIQSVDRDVIASLRVQKLIFGGLERELFVNSSFSPPTWTNFFEGVVRSSIELIETWVYGYGKFPYDFFDALEDHPIALYLLTTMELDQDTFRKLTKVSTLHLSAGLYTLHPYYFRNMTRLNDLDVSSNRINTINSSWNLNLTTLNLANNKLTEIDAFTFRGLNNLAILNMNQNADLVAVSLDSFGGLGQLHTLFLEGSRLIESFSIQAPSLMSLSFQNTKFAGCLEPGESSKYTPSLELLNMANSLIRSDDVIRHNGLSLFQGLHYLRFLYLSENIFYTLPSGVFQDLWSLVELDLRTCRIISIESGAFIKLNSLQTLFLQNNQITHFHPTLLNALPKLLVFYADNNELSRLDQDLFQNNSLLVNITLSNNHLAGFNKSTFDPVRESLQTIDISGNPLVCDCQIRWLVDWFHGSLQIYNESKTICSPVTSTLEQFRGKPLMNFDPKGLCDINAALYTGITVSGLALLVLLVLIYHNRWRLKYKFFLLKLAVLGYKEMQDDRDPGYFDFHINVIFTGDGDGWVQNQLRPFLLESCPHLVRNVFCDDHLMLGMQRLDALVHAVENSFKTLVLVTAAAVNDGDFMTKFRIAVNYMNHTQTENIILVFVEDVEYDELPLIVRLFLDDHGTCLQWPDDDEGQIYFWKKMKKYLAVNRKTDRRIPIE